MKGDAAGGRGSGRDVAEEGLDLVPQIVDRAFDRFRCRQHDLRRRPGCDRGIGDLAEVVATTAAHRGDAFAASRALIDTLKAEVPIWKHQLFADGSDEWVGTP